MISVFSLPPRYRTWCPDCKCGFDYDYADTDRHSGGSCRAGQIFYRGVQCPRYALTSDVARTIEHYVQSGQPIRCVDVTFSNPAKCTHVYEICNSINLDYSEFSQAALVAQNKEIRDALIAMGFDCFYDEAILENTDPMQFVPFYSNQVEML